MSALTYSQINHWMHYGSPRSDRTFFAPIVEIVRRFALSLLSISSFATAASGSPINNAEMQGEALNTVSVALSRAAGFLPLFAATFLVLAYGMATKKGPIKVWGSLMAVLSFFWWVIRDDAAMNLWLACK